MSLKDTIEHSLRIGDASSEIIYQLKTVPSEAALQPDFCEQSMDQENLRQSSSQERELLFVNIEAK